MSGIKATVMAIILFLLYVTIAAVPVTAPSLITIDDVIEYVNNWHEYELHIFDCSNRAAMFYELITYNESIQNVSIHIGENDALPYGHTWVCIDNKVVFGKFNGDPARFFNVNAHTFTTLEDFQSFAGENETEWRYIYL